MYCTGRFDLSDSDRHVHANAELLCYPDQSRCPSVTHAYERRRAPIRRAAQRARHQRLTASSLRPNETRSNHLPFVGVSTRAAISPAVDWAALFSSSAPTAGGPLRPLDDARRSTTAGVRVCDGRAGTSGASQPTTPTSPTHRLTLTCCHLTEYVPRRHPLE